MKVFSLFKPIFRRFDINSFDWIWCFIECIVQSIFLYIAKDSPMAKECPLQSIFCKYLENYLNAKIQSDFSELLYGVYERSQIQYFRHSKYVYLSNIRSQSIDQFCAKIWFFQVLFVGRKFAQIGQLNYIRIDK